MSWHVMTCMILSLTTFTERKLSTMPINLNVSNILVLTAIVVIASDYFSSFSIQINSIL